MSDEDRNSAFDDIVDDLLPVDLDWRRLVRSYPMTSMAALATGGFLVGRRHGMALASALSAMVAQEVQHNVESLFNSVGFSDSGAGLNDSGDDFADPPSDDE